MPRLPVYVGVHRVLLRPPPHCFVFYFGWDYSLEHHLVWGKEFVVAVMWVLLLPPLRKTPMPFLADGRAIIAPTWNVLHRANTEYYIRSIIAKVGVGEFAIGLSWQ